MIYFILDVPVCVYGSSDQKSAQILKKTEMIVDQTSNLVSYFC